MSSAKRYASSEPHEQPPQSEGEPAWSGFHYDPYIGFVPKRRPEITLSYLGEVVLAWVLTHAFVFIGAGVVGLLLVLILHLTGTVRAF